MESNQTDALATNSEQHILSLIAVELLIAITAWIHASDQLAKDPIWSVVTQFILQSINTFCYVTSTVFYHFYLNYQAAMTKGCL